jgi:hypothetical protein
VPPQAERDILCAMQYPYRNRKPSLMMFIVLAMRREDKVGKILIQMHIHHRIQCKLAFTAGC